MFLITPIELLWSYSRENLVWKNISPINVFLYKKCRNTTHFLAMDGYGSGWIAMNNPGEESGIRTQYLNH